MSRQLRVQALFLAVIASLLFQATPISAQVQDSEPLPRSGEIGPNPPDGGGDGGDPDEVLIRSRPENLTPVGLGAIPLEEKLSWIVRLLVWLGIGR